MALTTLASVQLIPMPGNPSVAWLNALITSVDKAIKKYLKRDIEQANYVEFYSGTGQRDLVLNQYPVWSPLTTIAAGSNGAAMPQATLNVESTSGFPSSGIAVVALGSPGYSSTVISYTGTTSTTFTGCSGGSGTLATGQNVGNVAIFQDPTGYAGQRPGGFAASSILTQGLAYMLMLDSGGTKSNRGTVRRIAGSGYGGGWWGGWPMSWERGKLAASQLPVWYHGDRNIKAYYTAGYETVPEDLTYAANMLVAYMVRSLPLGTTLQAETLGAYSYQVMQKSMAGSVPELGDLARTLAPYREVSWGVA